MIQITETEFLQELNKTDNFHSMKDAINEGFLVPFRSENGYALQVDTDSYEWLEVYMKDATIKYYGSK